MKIIPFLIVFASLCFFSCNTTVHMPIPGEGEVKKNNLYVEYMTVADSYMELEKYDKAIEYYSIAKKNKELFWTAYYKMGKAYAFSKNYSEARKVYNKLLSRDRENVDLQLSVAYLYAMEGNTEAAINIYDYLSSKYKENADILVNFVNVLIADEQLDYAKTKFEELKNTFPDNSNIDKLSKVLYTDDSENETDSEEEPSKDKSE